MKKWATFYLSVHLCTLWKPHFGAKYGPRGPPRAIYEPRGPGCHRDTYCIERVNFCLKSVPIICLLVIKSILIDYPLDMKDPTNTQNNIIRHSSDIFLVDFNKLGNLDVEQENLNKVCHLLNGFPSRYLETWWMMMLQTNKLSCTWTVVNYAIHIRKNTQGIHY